MSSDRASELAAEHEALIRLLADPSAYPDPTESVERVETHISQVFLTGRYVYKLKKPVRFDFLDFSTLEQREAACREELRLNRRMAPGVYLDVVPIVAAAGRLRLADPPGAAGGERIVDWVVKMKRLPAERMLDRLLAKRQVDETEIERLASYLADYYAGAEPVEIDGEAYRAAIAAHVVDNRRVLLASDGVDADPVRRIHVAQLRYLASRADLIRARAAAGRIVDGHGDLRPEHVSMIDPPAVFDCVEFSAEFRRVDVLDELGFLAMECDALAAARVGTTVLDAYLRKSGDDGPPDLTLFYKVYRATVRAKVAALRASQIDPSAGGESPRTLRRDRYLALAEGYLRAAGVRPLVIAVGGLMGTGKSTLARRLSEDLGIEILATDVLRKALLPGASSSDAFGEGRYRPEVRDRVYDELFRQAQARLAAGVSVILDGTFVDSARRSAVRTLGRECGADVALVRCVCPRQVSLNRIAARLASNRGDPSEARPEFYDRQAAEAARENVASDDIEVDTTEPLDAQAGRVFAALTPPFAKF